MGVNAAVSRAVDAAKAIEQVAVTLWAVGAIATSLHAPIVEAPSANATVPAGYGAPIAELTVAVKVTVSFVTAGSGEATSVVALANTPGSPSGAAAAIGVACATPLSARQPKVDAQTTIRTTRVARMTRQLLVRHFTPTQCLFSGKNSPNL